MMKIGFRTIAEYLLIIAVGWAIGARARKTVEALRIKSNRDRAEIILLRQFLADLGKVLEEADEPDFDAIQPSPAKDYDAWDDVDDM